jgi:hypothetical protein
MAANIEIESSEANFNLSATSGFARTTVANTVTNGPSCRMDGVADWAGTVLGTFY